MLSQFVPVAHSPPTAPPEPSLTACTPAEFLNLGSRLNLPEANENHRHGIRGCSQSQIIYPLLDGNVTSTAYASVLDSCDCPEIGKQVHAHLLKNGFHGREFIGTKLLQMYGKCGCVDDAVLLFDKMPDRNLYTYTAFMNLLLDDGLFEEAFMYFERMLFEDFDLEFFVFPVAFKICSGYGRFELVRQFHGLAIRTGVSSHIYLGNALIDTYGKCGSLKDSKKVLFNMPERDCVSWNSMITACATNGMVFEALEYLEEMSKEKYFRPNFVSWGALVCRMVENRYYDEAIEMLYKMRAAGCEPNPRTLGAMLTACARLRKVRLGREIYGYVTRYGFMSGPYVVNGLIDLYRRCGDMGTAIKIFSRFSSRDEVSFNTMIAGYFESGQVLNAKELFDLMECEGKQDLVSWNSMISGYADNFMFDESLIMFIALLNEGIEPNSFTLGSVLGACADIGSLRFGKGLHSYCIIKGLHTNLFVGGALVDMYCRCQKLESAEKALYQVPERDIVIWNPFVSGFATHNQTERLPYVLQRMRDDGFEPDVYTWNGIIAGYVENGDNEVALQLFSKIQDSNLRPDIYTVGITLTACSRIASIEKGKQIHAYVIRSGFESDPYVISSLIDMYSKCGVIKHAKTVHTRTKKHTLVTKNAMLSAYALHGHGEEGIAFFREMLSDDFMPDDVTFLAVLSSCVHVGSVDTGKELFSLMRSYGVIPRLKHYTCLVDLLSRAGRLKEAFELVESMPINPDSVTWGALLGGCTIHGDAELGEVAAHKLIELEPDNPGNYVMLANLYASTGKWDELKKARQQIEDENLWKNPGRSWIEDKYETHVFMASDRSHKRANEIYDLLNSLSAQMRLESLEQV